MKTNGKGNKCIKKAKNLQSCQISNGWIYYKTSSSTVCKVKTNGTKNKKIISNVLAYNVNNGWIYYSRYDKGFYKTKINGTSKKKISKMNPSIINILGDSIYFINSVNRIWYQ